MFYVNVEGAVYKEDKWLVVGRSAKEEHAGGLLSLVGGKVEDEGQSTKILERTLHRELFEEVGVKVKEGMDYVRSTSFTIADGSPVVDIVFMCEFDEGEPFAKSVDEVDAVYWMTAGEIAAHPEAPIWLIDSIKEAEALRKLRVAR
ncbi:NUDIX domain-containing protein [Neobacillus notoginsengisoli]|uniref:NUDIX domain-containing protein n=1 Tax=Neobacillus notoginsengisoli TaxID=1578198 RepID=A0A417YSV0_9BACI|nr:NUDIX domain-containing protein [Neobacillus notoginsengisoli]RHW39074.1 NUDIX domain-containing protein [Neobacillus notoginsengisoli]